MERYNHKSENSCKNQLNLYHDIIDNFENKKMCQDLLDDLAYKMHYENILVQIIKKEIKEDHKENNIYHIMKIISFLEELALTSISHQYAKEGLLKIIKLVENIEKLFPQHFIEYKCAILRYRAVLSGNIFNIFKSNINPKELRTNIAKFLHETKIVTEDKIAQATEELAIKKENEHITREKIFPRSNPNYKINNFKLPSESKIKNEDKSLRKRYTFNETLIKLNEKICFSQISSDAIGLFTKTGKLIKIGIIEKNNPEINLINLQDFYLKVADQFLLSKHDSETFFNDMSEYFKSDLSYPIQLNWGFSFKDIPLQALIQFLDYLKSKNTTEYHNTEEIIKNSKNLKSKIITTFIAYAQNQKYGDIILKLSEKLKSGTAKEKTLLKQVFHKLVELIDTSNKASQLISQYYPQNQNVNPHQVRQKMLYQTFKILDDVENFFKNTTSPQKIEHWIEDVNNTQASIVLFGSFFKLLKKNTPINKLNLEKLGLIFDDLPQDDLLKLENNFLEIYEKNYRGRPEQFEKLTQTFQKILQNKQSRFKLLLHESNLIGFIASRPYSENTDPSIRYIGAFNIDKKYQQYNMGGILFIKFIKNEFANGAKKLIGVIDYKSKNHDYYKHIGFKDRGDMYIDESGDKTMKIELTPENFKQ